MLERITLSDCLERLAASAAFSVSAPRVASRSISSARLRASRLLLCSIEQLRGDDTRREKRKQHDPIERICDNQGIVRRQKEYVENDERRRRRGEPEHAASGRARSRERRAGE